jgi:hypothetical protein
MATALPVSLHSNGVRYVTSERLDTRENYVITRGTAHTSDDVTATSGLGFERTKEMRVT